jgi:hypothetical protein
MKARQAFDDKQEEKRTELLSDLSHHLEEAFGGEKVRVFGEI